MPTGSRFESQATGRIVIALVMACLLALSTGLALLRANGAGAESPDQIKTSRHGLMIFSFERPASWSLTNVEGEGSPVGQGVVFEAPSTNGRRKLFAFELEMDRPTPPLDAAHILLSHLELPLTQSVTEHRARHGPFSVVLFAQERLLLAVMGIDGRQYLGLGLTINPDRQPVADSLQLLQRVIESVRDERFKPLAAPLQLPTGPELPVPAGLGALGYAHLQTLTHVVYHPLRSQAFYALHLVPIEIEPSPTAQNEARSPEEGFEWLDFLGVAHPPDKLAEALYARFFRATGSWPGPQHVRSFRTNGKSGYVLLLAGTRGPRMYEAIYGIWTGPQHAALIELVAEPEAVRPALDAARSVIETLAGISNAPDPPMQ